MPLGFQGKSTQEQCAAGELALESGIMEQTHLTGGFKNPKIFVLNGRMAITTQKIMEILSRSSSITLGFSRNAGQIVIRKGSKCCQNPHQTNSYKALGNLRENRRTLPRAGGRRHGAARRLGHLAKAAEVDLRDRHVEPAQDGVGELVVALEIAAQSAVLGRDVAAGMQLEGRFAAVER